MLRNGVICVVLFAVAASASAANWLPIDKDGLGMTEIDTSSVQKAGSTVKVWVRRTFNRPSREFEGGPLMTSWIQREIINCSTRQAAFASGMFMNGNIEVQAHVAWDPNRFTDIPPDTVTDVAATAVCSK